MEPMQIIGALGFCFGSLGFILSTIPTVAKASEAFKHCAQRFATYRRRLVKCEAKYREWKIKWRVSAGNDAGEHQSTIDDTIVVLELLKDRIHGMVEENCKEEKEREFWNKVKSRLFQNKETIARLEKKVEDVSKSVGYVLFTKDLIEDWLSTLERSVEDLELLVDTEFQHQTAYHLGTSPSHDQVEKIERLKTFMRTLKASADSLHGECAKVAMTTDWALVLQPPRYLREIDNWDRIGSIDISLHFLQQCAECMDARGLFLHARYQKEDPVTHDYENQVKAALSNVAEERTCDRTNIECCLQNPDEHRLDAIGILLEKRPEYFDSEDWKFGRVNLIYGLVNWALLLWDTLWFERLCCFGLHIEQGSAGDSIMHTFNSRKCNSVTHTRNTENHHSRLRNLGVTLAEIVLGKSLWLENDNAKPPQYSEWKDGQWRRTYRSAIIDEVLMKSTSTPLCDAIKFCLEDKSPVASETFEPGYLLRCIEKIHGPVKEWHTVESPNRPAPRFLHRPVPFGEPSGEGRNRPPHEEQEGSRQQDLNAVETVRFTVPVRDTAGEAETHPELRRKRKFAI